MAAIRSNAPPDLVLSVCHGDLVNVSHVRGIQLLEGRKQPGHKRKDRQAEMAAKKLQNFKTIFTITGSYIRWD